MQPDAAHKNYSYYYQGTNNAVVILVHGMTGSPAEMKFLAKRLNKQGFSVSVPALAGHCAGEAAFIASTWKDWYHSLEAELTRVCATHTSVYVAGICVGGALGLYLAYKNPENVQAVALYSATLNYDGWNTPFYFKYAPLLVPVGIRIPFIRNIKLSDAYPHGIKSDRLRNAIIKKTVASEGGLEGALPHFPARGLHENYKLNRKLKTALPSITTPTLLIHAIEDEVSNPRNSKYIKGRLGGLCELRLLQDSYHMIHVDQERDTVAEATADFFTRHSSSPS